MPKQVELVRKEDAIVAGHHELETRTFSDFKTILDICGIKSTWFATIRLCNSCNFALQIAAQATPPKRQSLLRARRNKSNFSACILTLGSGIVSSWRTETAAAQRSVNTQSSRRSWQLQTSTSTCDHRKIVGHGRAKVKPRIVNGVRMCRIYASGETPVFCQITSHFNLYSTNVYIGRLLVNILHGRKQLDQKTVSHICDNGICTRGSHLTPEQSEINNSRSKCSADCQHTIRCVHEDSGLSLLILFWTVAKLVYVFRQCTRVAGDRERQLFGSRAPASENRRDALSKRRCFCRRMARRVAGVKRRKRTHFRRSL